MARITDKMPMENATFYPVAFFPGGVISRGILSGGIFPVVFDPNTQ